MNTGKRDQYLSDNQPPIKKTENCTADIIRCIYSHKKNIRSIGPLYSVAYPETTSDSVSAWSNGARFDSKNSTTTKLEAAGAHRNIFQYEDWLTTKSWKWVDWDTSTSHEYRTVMKISKDITWTKPLTVAITAYLDWLSNPTIEKKILENNIKIRW